MTETQRADGAAVEVAEAARHVPYDVRMYTLSIAAGKDLYEQRCAVCREAWPCIVDRQRREIERLQHQLAVTVGLAVKYRTEVKR